MTRFDPSQNLTLVALRAAWPDRDDRDKPDYITVAVGDDGSVTVRPLTLTDVLEWVERASEGDVAA